jgi:hypothetical protein
MWVANLVAFNGDMMRELATQFLALAETQSVSGPIMIGHRQMGLSLLHTGDVVDARTHLDQAIALYDSAEHRPLATQFGQDVGAASLSGRSIAWWLLGHPDAALADTERALSVARETQHLATLVYVINFSIWCISTAEITRLQRHWSTNMLPCRIDWGHRFGMDGE